MAFCRSLIASAQVALMPSSHLYSSAYRCPPPPMLSHFEADKICRRHRRRQRCPRPITFKNAQRAGGEAPAVRLQRYHACRRKSATSVILYCRCRRMPSVPCASASAAVRSALAKSFTPPGKRVQRAGMKAVNIVDRVPGAEELGITVLSSLRSSILMPARLPAGASPRVICQRREART